MNDAPKLNVTRALLPPFEEYCAEIRELWDSHWLTNMGEKHEALRRRLEAYLDVPHVTLFTNGHLALEAALSALDLPRGGEVITTPLTFASTTHAIARCGLTPVFCDVRHEDFTLDPDRIEPLVTRRTVAILPVHVYGNPCDAPAIDAAARRHGLKLIYDAAHAFGVKCGGTPIARLGDASVFSFHATKVFNTIEGGAVCYRDGALAQPLNDLKNFGIRGPEEVAGPGGNGKMSEFQAAMGLCNLRHLDDEIAGRRRAAERYFERLGGVRWLTLPAWAGDVGRNFAYFPVLFGDGGISRDEAFRRLEKAGIHARKYFWPLTSDIPCYRGCPNAGNTPVAADIAGRVLTLPMYGDLQTPDVDAICDVLLGSR